MQTLPISKVKDKLNEFVDAVALTHEQVTITKNGSPAAVLIGADAPDRAGELIEAYVRARAPLTEVTVYQGGQLDHPVIIGVE